MPGIIGFIAAQCCGIRLVNHCHGHVLISAYKVATPKTLGVPTLLPLGATPQILACDLPDEEPKPDISGFGFSKNIIQEINRYAAAC